MVKEFMNMANEQVARIDAEGLADMASNTPGKVELYVPSPISEYKSVPSEGYEERGTEQQIADLYAALASARGEFGKIVKDSSVKVRMKSGGEYTFKYAPMENLLDATTPALSRHGLAVLLPFTRTKESELCTQFAIIAHKGGGRLVFTYVFNPIEEIKDFGGQTTYYQRYAYRSAMSLAADGDMDEMPEAKRGETSVVKSETRSVGGNGGGQQSRPLQQNNGGESSTKQQNSAPQEKQRTPPQPQQNNSANEARRTEAHNALKSLGFATRNVASAFVYEALKMEPFALGDPYLSVLTGDQLDKVCAAVVVARTKKVEETNGQPV